MIYWTTHIFELDEEGEEVGDSWWISRANQDGTGLQTKWISRTSLLGDGPYSGLSVFQAADYLYYFLGESKDVEEGEELYRYFYIGRVNLDGSEPQPHYIQLGKFANGSSLFDLTLEGQYFYFSIESGGLSLGRVRIDGSDEEPEWIGLDSYVSNLTANETHLYFTWSPSTDLVNLGRVRLDGTLMEKEFAQFEDPESEYTVFSLRATDSSLYWFWYSSYDTKEELRQRLQFAEIEAGALGEIHDILEEVQLPWGSEGLYSFPDVIAPDDEGRLYLGRRDSGGGVTSNGTLKKFCQAGSI